MNLAMLGLMKIPEGFPFNEMESNLGPTSFMTQEMYATTSPPYYVTFQINSGMAAAGI